MSSKDLKTSETYKFEPLLKKLLPLYLS